MIGEQKVKTYICAGKKKSHMHLWYIRKKYNRLGQKDRKMTREGWLMKKLCFLGRKWKASGSHWEQMKHMGERKGASGIHREVCGGAGGG
jgi:hypothetical protein